MKATFEKIGESIPVGIGVFIGWNLTAFTLGFLPVLIEKLGK